MEIKLIELDSELWEKYTGAYGSVVNEVAVLMGAQITEPQIKLRRLDMEEKSDYRIAFDNLCENLSHQMSFYNATYLALPYLVTLMDRDMESASFEWKLDFIVEVGLCLATDIPSNHDEPKDDAVLQSYRASILKLGELVKQFVDQYEDEIKNLDFYRRSMLITALLAVLGSREEAYALIMASWEQPCMMCDACQYCEEDIVLSENEFRENIVPAGPAGEWDGKSYDDTYLWLSSLLNRLGAEEELELLSYFYGTYTCPACGKKGCVMELMKNYLFED